MLAGRALRIGRGKERNKVFRGAGQAGSCSFHVRGSCCALRKSRLVPAAGLPVRSSDRLSRQGIADGSIEIRARARSVPLASLARRYSIIAMPLFLIRVFVLCADGTRTGDRIAGS
jgi:hypothetical protein